MKLCLLIGIIILNFAIYGSLYFNDGQMDLRYFRQNEVDYQQKLSPRTEIWGGGKVGASLNEFSEMRIFPVVDQVLGKSGPKQRNEASDNQFWINEALLKAKWEYLNITLGRQIWSFGDGNLISDQSWHPVRQFFDGVNVQFKTNYNKLDILYADIETIRTDYKNKSNKNVYGFYHQLMSNDLFSSFNLQFDFYFIQYRNDYIIPDNGDVFDYYTKSSMVGSRLEVKNDIFNAKGELIKQESYYGRFILKNAFYNLQFGGTWDKLKSTFKYVKADKNYKPYFSEDHFLLGTMDLIHTKNIKSYGFYFEYTTPWGVNVNFNYLTYFRISDNQTVYRSNGDSYSTDKISSSKKIGNELDLNFLINRFKNINIYVNTGVFIPRNYFKDVYSSNKIFQFVLGSNVSF